MPWTDGQKKYAAMITRADRHVGQLLKILDELKLASNTAVFVTSDNGAHSGEQKGYEFFKSNGILRGEKGTVYEGGIRVPLIARWPGRIKPKTTSNHLCAFWDVMPTLAEIAGADVPKAIDGVSCVPALTGTKQRTHDFLYWEHQVYDFKTAKLRPERMAQAVRAGNWKAVRPKGGAPLELYDLATDPSESKNLAASNAALIARMEEYMKSAHQPPRPHNTGTQKWVS
jgi:arylsulfatase A-like enzyme